MQKPDKPFFNKRIFWDVDSEKMNYDVKASFIIERVFERGDVEDIRMCRRFYGDERISNVLLNAKFLPEKRMYLASAVINKPVNLFLCYTMRQSKTAHLPY
jgi:hypothetical protein